MLFNVGCEGSASGALMISAGGLSADDHTQTKGIRHSRATVISTRYFAAVGCQIGRSCAGGVQQRT